LPYSVEETLVITIFKYNDPILMATYLLYSKYNVKYFNEILEKVSNALTRALDNIKDNKKLLLYKEFWFILVFNKCPLFTDKSLQSIIDSKINILTSGTSSKADMQLKRLIGKYLNDESNNFITWRIENIDIVKDITFRTHRRTIFRKYGKAKELFEASI
jgi:GTPase SAR1 family protein